MPLNFNSAKKQNALKASGKRAGLGLLPIDPGFAQNGRYNLPLDEKPGLAIGVIPTDDGQLLIPYYQISTEEPQEVGRARIARIDHDGNVDNSFGEGTGFIDVSFRKPGVSEIQGVYKYPDNRFLSWGHVLPKDTYTSKPHLVRLLASGAPDPEFGNNGVVDLDALLRSYGSFFQSNGCLVHTDGRISVGYNSAVDELHYIVRLTPQGQLDTSFQDDGRLEVKALGIVNSTMGLSHVTDDPTTGKLLAYGITLSAENPNVVGIVRQYDFDGNQTEFGENKVATISAEARNIFIAGVATLPRDSGQFFLAHGSNMSTAVALITALTEQGKPFLEFNNGVPIFTDVGGSGVFNWATVKEDTSKALHYLVAGKVSEGSFVSTFVMTRFLPDGRPDENFTSVGALGTVPEFHTSLIAEIGFVQTSSNRVVIAGSSSGAPIVIAITLSDQ